MPCYKSGGCGAYEMRSCRECPASKPECSMCNGTGEITTIPPSQTKGEHRAAKISEIIRDLQEIQEKYGDVGVYVNPWAEAVNRPVIAAKSSFVDEAGSIQAVIIA